MSKSTISTDAKRRDPFDIFTACKYGSHDKCSKQFTFTGEIFTCQCECHQWNIVEEKLPTLGERIWVIKRADSTRHYRTYERYSPEEFKDLYAAWCNADRSINIQ